MCRIEIPKDNILDLKTTINRILDNETRHSGYLYRPQPVELELIDEDNVIGGLTGATNWEWLYIETLAVEPAYQGRGFGRKLVLESERIARQRNCRGAWVDTFSFQSPQFYLRLGYRQFGELQNYPGTETRIFLFKLFEETQHATKDR